MAKATDGLPERTPFEFLSAAQILAAIDLERLHELNIRINKRASEEVKTRFGSIVFAFEEIHAEAIKFLDEIYLQENVERLNISISRIRRYAVLLNGCDEDLRLAEDISQNALLFTPPEKARKNPLLLESLREYEKMQHAVTKANKTISRILNFLDQDTEAEFLIFHADARVLLSASRSSNKIPEPIAAPIRTNIVDDVLVSVAGNQVEASAEIENLIGYLLTQATKIGRLLFKANADRQVVDAFAETKSILAPWTAANILCLGAHLEFLESFTESLREELSATTFARVSSFLINCRRIVDSTDDWNEFLAAAEREKPGSPDELQIELSNASSILAKEHESVDPHLAQRLNLFAAMGKGVKTATVGIGSSIRSMTNVMISATRYVVGITRHGFKRLSAPKVTKLARVFCRLGPTLANLARLHPNFAWYAGFDEDFRMMCAALSVAHPHKAA